MTEFNDVFVDVSSFQRPAKWQARASNLIVWLTVLIILTGGWFLKDWMMTQYRLMALGENAPAIPYPVKWIPQQAPDLGLQVFDPDSQSAFPARQEVLVRPLLEGDIAIAWPEQRQQLPEYHELGRTLVTLPDGRKALVLSYTYTPAGDASSQVTVRAEDVAFMINDGRADQLVVMTLAADASEWDAVWPTFSRILEKMGVPVLE
jgi:hypothetical protein